MGAFDRVTGANKRHEEDEYEETAGRAAKMSRSENQSSSSKGLASTKAKGKGKGKKGGKSSGKGKGKKSSWMSWEGNSEYDDEDVDEDPGFLGTSQTMHTDELARFSA